MEILIKAKQANNLQFEFLNQSSRLNPFYKHTLQAMKDGNYPTEGGQAPIENFDNNIESSGSIFANYYNTSANQPKVRSHRNFIENQTLLKIIDMFFFFFVATDSCSCYKIQTISRLCIYTANQ